MSWYAIRAATRQERRAAENLADAGFCTYLPVQTRWRITPRVKESIERPLFDGYLFVVCDEGEYRDVLDVSGVHQFVRLVNRYGVAEPMPIPDAAIEGVMGEEWSGRFDYTKPSRREKRLSQIREEGFQKGASIKIVDGVYAGWMAQVLHMTSSNRRVAVETAFGQRITLDVEQLDAA
jgi:transcription antitermination factor NusG